MATKRNMGEDKRNMEGIRNKEKPRGKGPLEGKEREGNKEGKMEKEEVDTREKKGRNKKWRDGLLDRLVEEEDSAWAAAHSFYAALLLHVTERWRVEHLTIVSCGPLLQETEATARRAPAVLVRRLEATLCSSYTVGSKQVAREQLEREARRS